MRLSERYSNREVIEAVAYVEAGYSLSAIAYDMGAELGELREWCDFFAANYPGRFPTISQGRIHTGRVAG
jgi:hypothetical protein